MPTLLPSRPIPRSTGDCPHLDQASRFHVVWEDRVLVALCDACWRERAWPARLEPPDTVCDDEVLPALRGRCVPMPQPQLACVRRALWQAFKHGDLTGTQLARTVERLEPPCLAF